MHTESGEAIARAIAHAHGVGGARAALIEGLGDVPDDDDAAELARQLAALTEGLSAGEAMGEALAVGVQAVYEVQRARELCNDAAALHAEAGQAIKRARAVRER